MIQFFQTMGRRRALSCLSLWSLTLLASCGGGAGDAPSSTPASVSSGAVSADRADPQASVSSASAPGQAMPAVAAETLQPVYRFAKTSNGAYFLTGNAAEKDAILARFPDFRYEGIAFQSTTDPAGVPVYRFANLRNGGYFFTANPDERDTVIRTRSDLRFEGTSFSVVSAGTPLAEPVYRLANLQNGAYLYTAWAGEREAAVATGIWRDEGVAFHAPSDGTTQPDPQTEVFSNSARSPIPDGNASGISSRVEVSRLEASGTVQVDVDITHSFVGDLYLDLIHPDGTVYSLRARTGGDGDDIKQSYFVPVGVKPAVGTWVLRVRDVVSRDVGVLNRWSLTFGSTVGAPKPIPMPPEGWALSGTISMAPTAAVDSDTNDTNQSNRRSNDDLPLAQQLRAPVLLVGSVNQPQAGPFGANYQSGDEFDVYRVSLRAGQVIELEFSAEPEINDLDLYLFNSQEDVVGDSAGLNRYECIRVTREGDYRIAVHAYEGASIYNLRIGAPGEAPSCANSTSALSTASIAKGQLVAKPKEDATSAAHQRETLLEAGRVTTAAAPAAAGVPQLLRLPESARERAQGLRRLAGGSSRESAASASVAPVPARSAALQEVIDTVAYAKRLSKTGQYAYVEPNRYADLQALVGNFPPDDRGYAAQRWHYEMINLPAAMARVAALPQQPSRRPLVAVIDSGIVSNHPDLAAQISDGYSFISVNTEGDRNTTSPDDPSGAQDRPHFHGTHVAGTIAAVTFNGDAGAGVAPMAQLMPLRVFRPDAQGATSYDIIQAILYAAGAPNSSRRLPSRKADVINLSLGGTASCPAYYRDAIATARAQGVIVVAAAGNEASNNRGLAVPVGTPANCPGVISVGALDARARQTSYSNSGSNLMVAAPGGDASQSSNGSGYPDTIYSTIGAFAANGQRVPSFGPMDGTSMASPHVAGVMALMRYVNPSITPAQIDTLLIEGKLTDDILGAGRDNASGYGLINARKAVDAALGLQGGGSTPAPQGTVTALPSTLDFGSLQSSAEFELRTTADTTERVTSITSGSVAVTLTPKQVDPATRLGTYLVTVDRARMSLGTHYPVLIVRTTTRQFTIQLTIQKLGSSGANSQADFGLVYVLLIDPESQEVIGEAPVTASQGVYRWSYSGLKTHSKVQILAGADLDNDFLICQRGEPCGAYPVLSDDLRIVDLTVQRTGLDFSVAPFGGTNVSLTGVGTGGLGSTGIRVMRSGSGSPRR